MKIRDLTGTECLQIYNVAKTLRKWFEEHFCYYYEDVNVEGYIPDIERRLSPAMEHTMATK